MLRMPAQPTSALAESNTTMRAACFRIKLGRAQAPAVNVAGCHSTPARFRRQWPRRPVDGWALINCLPSSQNQEVCVAPCSRPGRGTRRIPQKLACPCLQFVMRCWGHLSNCVPASPELGAECPPFWSVGPLRLSAMSQVEVVRG